jgi:single-strand DNA-binding protein
MGSVNRVILLGNVGKDPEIRYIAQGRAIASFSIATTETWADAKGAKQEHTEWTRIETFGKYAEFVEKFVTKGASLYVEGKLRTDSWDDKKSGEKKYATKVMAERIVFAGRKPGEPATPSDLSSARGSRHPQAPSGAPAASQPDMPPIGAYLDDIPL